MQVVTLHLFAFYKVHILTLFSIKYSSVIVYGNQIKESRAFVNLPAPLQMQQTGLVQGIHRFVIPEKLKVFQACCFVIGLYLRQR